MQSDKPYYSAEDVKSVAELIQSSTVRYEQLFEDLAKQMYVGLNNGQYGYKDLDACYQLAEQAKRDFQMYFPIAENIACNRGCSHCCYLPVEVPPQVIPHIVDFIRSEFTPAEQETLIARLKSYSERIIAVSNSGLNTVSNTVPSRTPCPLLGADNSCSIYSHRPPACRAFTSPDPELCLRSVHSGSNVPQSPVGLRIYESLTAALMAKVKQDDNNLKQVAFISALYQHLADMPLLIHSSR